MNNLILCIYKIYNLIEPVNVENIINNNDYYSLIDFTDYFEFQTGNGNIILETPNETIEINYNESKSGSHCVVHNGFFNGEKIVVKERKTRYDDEAEAEAFATEIFLQVCLFCLQNHINKCSKYTLTTIPRVYKVCKLNHSPAIIMQQVHITLTTFIETNTLKEIIPVLLIIICDLIVLQSTCEFMHRDLHNDNIMIEMLPKYKTFDIGNLSIKSRFQPYFIDFGFACFNFKTTCLQLSQHKISVKNYYEDCKFNSTHDLKTLFASIFDDMMKINHGENENFFSYLKYKFTPYLPYSQKNKLYLFFYQQINKIDNNFLPKTMFEELKSLYDQLS